MFDLDFDHFASLLDIRKQTSVEGTSYHTNRVRTASNDGPLKETSCLIINTGGTFSMEPTEHGLTPSKGLLE